ncbi:alpha/beta fold hydrolase [Facklamia miroungae]|uniref:Lysophospholipase n=1 Tax=Facklamia miroungae TaxID=120956 RepID=A0A1G7U5X8_9LACT|nr:alpha/beta fold hydrolase [Facklamia miroungae]NKZ29924.1 alpha/beta hydrolase [Facklamia miroungae]SDG42853.1 lysophospholipase [Facklamia miroungae]
MKMGKFLKLGVPLMGLSIGYKLHRAFRHPLPKISHAERLLERLELNTSIDWLEEKQFASDWQKKLMPFLERRRQSGKIHTGPYSLAYDFYALENAVATCVIVHGFNEYKEKYLELIYYLLQAGIQAIVYDARGHGESKLAPNQTQIDCLSFQPYIEDLELVVGLAKNMGGSERPLFLFGHSMGGAVATRLTQTYPQIINGLILSAPMLAIHSSGLPMEFAHIISRMMQKIGQGKKYLPAESNLKKDNYLTFQMPNHLSNSEVRGRFFFDLNRNLHRYPTRSGSYNWLNAALDTLQKIHAESEIKKISCPSLIFRAERDQVVKKEGIYHFYNRLPFSFNILVPSSEHEILSGHDDQVRMIVSQIIEFISNNAE